MVVQLKNLKCFKGKWGATMRFHILKPFIFQAIYALLLFVGIPLILVLSPWIELKIIDSLGFVFIIVGIILYFNIILFEILPGCYALWDLLTNSFDTQKMVFLQSYADRRRLLATKEERKLTNAQKKKYGALSTYEHSFFDLIFSTSDGKMTFFTTIPCTLNPGECYTVQYGKHSKTIVSIVSEKGEELLFDLVKSNTRGQE